MTKRRSLFVGVVLACVGIYAWRSRSTPTPARDLKGIDRAYAAAKSEGERRAVLVRAASVEDPGVVRWLAAIAERDQTLANQASSLLGTTKSKAAAGELREIATSSAPTLVRANAVRALGESGSPTELPALEAMLGAPGERLRIRQEAALALGKIGDRSAVPALIATIQSANEAAPDAEQLRISALQSLGRLASPEAHAFLEQYGRGSLSAIERAFVARATSASN
jgi:HEAT repeat protein